MAYMDDSSFATVNEGTNGKSEILNPDEIFITPHLKKDLVNIRINKMVKAAKEVISSTWVAPILLATLLGFVIYDRQATNATFAKQLQDQHDLLIRLETLHEVDEKEKSQLTINRKLDDDKEQVRREKENTRLDVIEALIGSRIPRTN